MARQARLVSHSKAKKTQPPRAHLPHKTQEHRDRLFITREGPEGAERLPNLSASAFLKNKAFNHTLANGRD
jgi:hypothetical protein